MTSNSFTRESRGLRYLLLSVEEAGPLQPLHVIEECAWRIASAGVRGPRLLSKLARFLVGRVVFMNMRSPSLSRAIELASFLPMVVEALENETGENWPSKVAASVLESILPALVERKGVETLLGFFIGQPWIKAATARQNNEVIAIAISAFLSISPFLDSEGKTSLLVRSLTKAGLFPSALRSNDAPTDRGVCLGGFLLKHLAVAVNELRNPSAVDRFSMRCGDGYWKDFVSPERNRSLFAFADAISSVLSEVDTKAAETGVKAWRRLRGGDQYRVDVRICVPNNKDLVPEFDAPETDNDNPYLWTCFLLTHEAAVVLGVSAAEVQEKRQEAMRVIIEDSVPEFLKAQAGVDFQEVRKAHNAFAEVVKSLGDVPPLLFWPPPTGEALRSCMLLTRAHEPPIETDVQENVDPENNPEDPQKKPEDADLMKISMARRILERFSKRLVGKHSVSKEAEELMINRLRVEERLSKRLLSKQCVSSDVEDLMIDRLQEELRHEREERRQSLENLRAKKGAEKLALRERCTERRRSSTASSVEAAMRRLNTIRAVQIQSAEERKERLDQVKRVRSLIDATNREKVQAATARKQGRAAPPPASK